MISKLELKDFIYKYEKETNLIQTFESQNGKNDCREYFLSQIRIDKLFTIIYNVYENYI